MALSRKIDTQSHHLIKKVLELKQKSISQKKRPDNLQKLILEKIKKLDSR